MFERLSSLVTRLVRSRLPSVSGTSPDSPRPFGPKVPRLGRGPGKASDSAEEEGEPDLRIYLDLRFQRVEGNLVALSRASKNVRITRGECC